MVSSHSAYSNNDVPLVFTPRDWGLLIHRLMSFEGTLLGQIKKKHRRKASKSTQILNLFWIKIKKLNKLLCLGYFSYPEESRFAENNTALTLLFIRECHRTGILLSRIQLLLAAESICGHRRWAPGSTTDKCIHVGDFSAYRLYFLTNTDTRWNDSLKQH